MSLVAPGKAGISVPVTVMLPVDESQEAEVIV